jgi:hypothetical protein
VEDAVRTREFFQLHAGLFWRSSLRRWRRRTAVPRRKSRSC